MGKYGLKTIFFYFFIFYFLLKAILKKRTYFRKLEKIKKTNFN